MPYSIRKPFPQSKSFLLKPFTSWCSKKQRPSDIFRGQKHLHQQSFISLYTLLHLKSKLSISFLRISALPSIQHVSHGWSGTVNVFATETIWCVSLVTTLLNLGMTKGNGTIFLWNALLPFLIPSWFRPTRPKLLPFDHIRPHPSQVLKPPPKTAILYANPLSPNFNDLHSTLFKLSDGLNPRVEYVFRHVPPADLSTASKSYLSGYGVALDLKKTDYLAVDDRHTSHSSSKCRHDFLEDLSLNSQRALQLAASKKLHNYSHRPIPFSSLLILIRTTLQRTRRRRWTKRSWRFLGYKPRRSLWIPKILSKC